MSPRWRVLVCTVACLLAPAHSLRPEVQAAAPPKHLEEFENEFRNELAEQFVAVARAAGLEEELELDEASARLADKVYLSSSFLMVMAIVLFVLLLSGFNLALKILSLLIGRISLLDLLKPVAMIVLVFVNTQICYIGTYKTDFTMFPAAFTDWCENMNAYWSRIIIWLSILWVFVDYLRERYWIKRAPVTEGEIFVATDVYTNLTENMFMVIVRFVVQTCLLLILVAVGELCWQLPVQREVHMWRRLLNFTLAFVLQLQMFGQLRWRSAWQDLRTLWGVYAVEYRDTHGKYGKVKDIYPVSTGDYYARFFMSIVAHGVFHRFILLSYPIFIFGHIGQHGLFDIVKDLVAIFIVQEICQTFKDFEFKCLVDPALQEEGGEAEGEEAPAEAS